MVVVDVLRSARMAVRVVDKEVLVDCARFDLALAVLSSTCDVRLVSLAYILCQNQVMYQVEHLRCNPYGIRTVVLLMSILARFILSSLAVMMPTAGWRDQSLKVYGFSVSKKTARQKQIVHIC